MKTHEVNAAIRRHYPVNEYALMFEVGNTTGGNVRRHADAVVMNLWPSRGLLIEGIEVKVSRSDWTKELKTPEKAELISQYCDRWWIVAPEGIVHEHEVPAMWGYMVASPKGALRVVKQAPKKEAHEVSALNRGFVAAMLRRASEADGAVVDKLVALKVAKAEEDIQKRIDKEVERRTQKFSSTEEKLAKLKESGLDLFGRWDSAEDIMRAYKLGKALRDNYSIGGLKHKADDLIKVAETLHAVHAQLFVEETVK